MPPKIKGHKLSPKRHRQWKEVFEKTGSGAEATAAVEKSMGLRPKKSSSKKGKK